MAKLNSSALCWKKLITNLESAELKVQQIENSNTKMDLLLREWEEIENQERVTFEKILMEFKSTQSKDLES